MKLDQKNALPFQFLSSEGRKKDSEQVCSHGSAGHKYQSKPVECHDNIWDSVGFNNINGSLKENWKESTYYMRDDVDPLSYRVDDGTASELGYTLTVDDLANDAEKAVAEFVAPIPTNHPPVATDSFDDPVFCVDKSVLKCQLPELIVCYRENTYQIVKDICIDEGVPSQYNFSFDTDVDCNHLCPFLPENDLKDEIVNEKVDLVVPVPDALKSSLAKENLDLRQQIPDELKLLEGLGSCHSSSNFDTRDLPPTRDEGLETNENIENYVPKETSMIGELLMPDRAADLSNCKFYRNSIEESKQQSVQNPRQKAQLKTVSAYEEHHSYDKGALLTSPPMVSRGEESDHGSEDESLITVSQNSAANDLGHGFHKIDMVNLALIPAAEESENVRKEVDSAGTSLTSEAKEVDNAGKEAKLETDAFDHAFKTLPRVAADELSCDSKAETGINTLTFDSIAPPPSCGQSCLQNANEESLDTRGIFIPQNNITEPVLNHPCNSPGETSFSASGHLSGLITYSGPIAYSGSLSIRSDSSTTSTRSFAFPILQSEWNSSPVRMAKAERKHVRRHKRWGHSLLCCRF